jgi:hypothetical protein
MRMNPPVDSSPVVANPCRYRGVDTVWKKWCSERGLDDAHDPAAKLIGK